MIRARFAGRLKLGLLYPSAIAAGWAFDAAGIPLPWMLGPLFITAAASLRFGELPVPGWTRGLGQIIVASAIGINLTPSALTALASNLDLMLVCGAALILASMSIAVALVRISGVDKATALFATLPGGPVELAVLAEKYGGRGGLVAFSQMLRIAVIVTLVPALLLAGGQDAAPGWRSAETDPVRLVLVLGIGLSFALALHAARIINAYFLGPLVGVGLATAIGLPVTAVPWSLIVAAQILLGASLGTMFTVAVFRYAASFVLHAAWIAVLITLIGAGFGVLCAWLAGLAPGVLVLANAPGSATEMAVLAKTLGLDATLVTAFHLVRILMIVPTAELIYRGFARAIGRT